MRELFIYYRVRSTDVPAALAAVHAFQAQLRRQFPHLTARLLRRPEEADGRQTWMETYSTDPRHDAAGITPGLQSEIEARAAALLPIVDGPRHTEVFLHVSPSPCDRSEPPLPAGGRLES
jgi:Domain of unknown function (DUF4936)